MKLFKLMAPWAVVIRKFKLVNYNLLHLSIDLSETLFTKPTNLNWLTDWPQSSNLNWWHYLLDHQQNNVQGMPALVPPQYQLCKPTINQPYYRGSVLYISVCKLASLFNSKFNNWLQLIICIIYELCNIIN